MEEYFSIRVQTFFCQTRPFRLFQHNLPKADYRPISEMRRKREFSAPASTAAIVAVAEISRRLIYFRS
jgi:hypothetical protein